ncbi:MAG: rod shape-determining protein RodA [Clostridia bacterium]|nr:rod shape-determining protein RodA [Clostridia bacterium]
MQRRFQRTLAFIERNKFNPKMLNHFDWGLLVLVLSISFFGVVCIFSATAVPVDGDPSQMSFLEIIRTQPTRYASLQLLWILLGTVAMAFIVFIKTDYFERYSNTIYWLNLALLLLVLFTERGRGAMAGWFRWGSDMNRTIQPSEFGKLAIIIALAKIFAGRKKPISNIKELGPVVAYVGVPLLLIVLQPDVGTALVYLVIFGVMLFASGTSYKLIFGILMVALLMMFPLWYYLNNRAGDDFRLQRILVFLDQTLDTNGSGMQMNNARIALGSGGMWGKGMFSEGNFASLNYIPDDYTDFIFAIVGESFGFVGAAILVLALLTLIIWLIVLSSRATTAFGTYVIIGVAAMFLFHIVENVGMVIGLLPVTGIPLSFVSYGGSNLLTNYMAMGLVFGISMRSRDDRQHNNQVRAARL